MRDTDAPRAAEMKTILVIEDNADTLKNLVLMLEMEGFRVLAAGNGRAGVEIAQREVPDVVLCDVMMPLLDGHGVLAALRGDPRTAGVPFIFLTARGDRADLRAGMNLGADDYITKPADGDEVLDAVRARLTRQSDHERVTLGRVEVDADFSSALPLQKLGLTMREAEVLLWIAQGKTNPEVASILGNAEGTVKIHVNRIFEKLGVDNRHAAALQALEILNTPHL